ncbi:hypothetical protein E2C01_036002 [Portunus trituberculatus]|uniref:Uncharacterized protein n=1 Tax=Portunus trituberculatus TaxID=210409 RepID=A0A5B7F5R4_PORTR|nr:hypothetical protein [Portunus trituberculatus]
MSTTGWPLATQQEAVTRKNMNRRWRRSKGKSKNINLKKSKKEKNNQKKSVETKKNETKKGKR